MSPRLTDEELDAIEQDVTNGVLNGREKTEDLLSLVAELRRERERADVLHDVATTMVDEVLRERETSAQLLELAEEQAETAQALSVELEREREQTTRLRTALSDILDWWNDDDAGPGAELFAAARAVLAETGG